MTTLISSILCFFKQNTQSGSLELEVPYRLPGRRQGHCFLLLSLGHLGPWKKQMWELVFYFTYLFLVQTKSWKSVRFAIFFWAIYYKSLTWSKVILGRIPWLNPPFEVSSAEGAINCRDFWAEDEFLLQKENRHIPNWPNHSGWATTRTIAIYGVIWGTART